MTNKTFKKIILLITYAVFLFLLVGNIGQVANGAKNLISMLSPLIIGICIAFVVNLLLNLYEKKAFNVLWKKSKFLAKYKRGISLSVTYVTILAFFVLLIFIIVPQIISSGTELVKMLPSYAKDAQEYIYNLLDKFGLRDNLGISGELDLKDIISQAANIAGVAVNSVINFAAGLTSGIVSFFVSMIFSVYILAKKEKLLGIVKKVIYAVVRKDISDKIISVAKNSTTIFSRFVGGQLTEALILGVLCFIGMVIFKLPYAPLISPLIGIMNLIPILGAYISAIPSAIIIALESPAKAIIFIVFIIVLQQLEGNLIYPKVVGNAIGLDGFWVFLAITIGGSAFGVAGMLIGVPTMAIIYALVGNFVSKRLKKKDITV